MVGCHFGLLHCHFLHSPHWDPHRHHESVSWIQCDLRVRDRLHFPGISRGEPVLQGVWVHQHDTGYNIPTIHFIIGCYMKIPPTLLFRYIVVAARVHPQYLSPQHRHSHSGRALEIACFMMHQSFGD